MLGIVLDTFLDGRSSYGFLTNPDVMPLIYGAQWTPAYPVIRGLFMNMVCGLVLSPLFTLLQGQGRAGLAVRLTCQLRLGARRVRRADGGLPRAARPVGIDNSERQLATARALQVEHNLTFPLSSVAQTLAAKRRERIDPDQELVALRLHRDGARREGDGIGQQQPAADLDGAGRLARWPGLRLNAAAA